MNIEVGSGVLSKSKIMHHVEEVGDIVIDPYNPKNVGSTSYDVTLGEYYCTPLHPKFALNIYNPYKKSDVQRVWGQPERAPLAKEIAKYGSPLDLFGARDDDRVILIPPRELYLCHTNEFIGSRRFAAEMQGRSSWGRNFIEICRDAQWGGLYLNRWTMEVANTSDRYWIPLIVGRRIAQIVFHEVSGLESTDATSSDTKYQSVDELETIKAKWTPEAMLPRLYDDREVKELFSL